MSELAKQIKDFSDSELLLELIERNESSNAPKHVTYCYPHQRCTVGIGADEVADIVLSDDALKELKELNGNDA